MLCYCIIDSRLGLNTNCFKENNMIFTFKLPVKVQILYHFYNFPLLNILDFFKFLLKCAIYFDILY